MSAISLPASSWIINKRQDLFWFIGAALLGYLLLIASAAQGELPLRLLVLWAFAVDGPHVFSTATRVLLDPKERKRVGFLWLALIPLCLAGPAIIFAGNQHIFYMVIATWSHYHISKQHMGFVFIYKRKARETSDFKLDKYFVLTLLILPYLFYVTVLLFNRTDLLPIFLVPAIIFAIYYSIHQAQKATINRAKILLLLACIPLTWTAFLYAAADVSSSSRFVTAVVALNVLHSFQYLRLTFFHNQNRYGETGGLLGLISRKWVYFFAAAVLLALPWRVGENFLPLIGPMVVGLTFFHFVLDSKIWRVRGDAELAAALRLN